VVHVHCLLAMHICPISTSLYPGFLLFLNVEEYHQESITNVSQEMHRAQQFSFGKINTSVTLIKVK
jgi:hypothetical protein